MESLIVSIVMAVWSLFCIASILVFAGAIFIGAPIALHDIYINKKKARERS